MDTTAKPLKPLDTWKKNPDPKSEPELAQQRIRQWRRYSRDPFESEKNGADASPKQGEGSNDKVPGPKPDNPRMTSWGSGNTVVQTGPDKGSEIKHPELKHPGSSWVHLFYDLAWAASFASLTGSGKFDNPLDTVNYFMFFAAVLWLWTSHTLYSIHFYTNDWFHLISTFLQLFIFGMLAATTKGYDITNYIAHSPGMPKLRESNNMDDLDPQEYTEEMTAYLSMLVLAISFAATRIIQLVQYIRVLYHCGSTKPSPKNQNTTRLSWILRFRSWISRFCSWISRFRPWISRARFRRLPPQLIAITIGLLISSPMFIAALGIAASNFGETVLGASLKLGLWVGGFLIEVVSHLSMPVYWWMKNQDITTINASDRKKRMLPTAPDVKLYERLQTITTIILGEGINGIAGTLSTVLAAPGIGRTVGINIVCAACTIWFIAYIYFEGPKGETSPALTSLRYLLWMILHLPFLVSTVLMLIGMKSQFLLTSFLSALFGTMDGFNRIRNEQLSGNPNMTYWRTNPEMKRFLLKRGIVWEKEFQKFSYAFGNATIEERSTVMPIWLQRFSLTVAVTLFKDFNGEDDSIPSDLQDIITGYYENSTQVIEDLKIIPTYPKDAVYYQILGGLLDGFVLSTRCVIGFAGLILITLGLQDFIHSWPSDRYQWGVIASRISMGLILCLLLLLNIGKYQDLFVATDKLNQRAGVFQWLEVFWVLPTIAIAYGLEYLVEMVRRVPLMSEFIY
ncbi:transmembrane protein, putative [Rhizoctonia solani AG-3 Rhs1AP]|uniref:Transmembrane protein, putative n=1 Tax=Rhizoctonia solani AG-3 Rhs1AP TaxID=1086054 RepID=X8J7P5_9AGAM|nr:transmembrane protein, putative [Rhizoctonia solani AG-3 Rhs1AP]